MYRNVIVSNIWAETYIPYTEEHFTIVNPLSIVANNKSKQI